MTSSIPVAGSWNSGANPTTNGAGGASCNGGLTGKYDGGGGGDAESYVSAGLLSASSPDRLAPACCCPLAVAIPLYSRAAAPAFLASNPFLHRGYRVSLSYRDCVRSMFVWTNETLNIWTHLLGFLYFAGHLVYCNAYVLPAQPGTTFYDHVVISAFLMCAMTTMLLSALYHTFGCHSEAVFRFWLRLDLCGIMLSTWATYFVGFFYGFYCFAIWQTVYCGMLILLTPAIAAFVLRPSFLADKRHRARTCAFALVIFISILPLSHWILLNDGFSHPDVQLFVQDVVIQWLILGAGVTVFAFKIPEKLWPGSVDYIGASHQLWHCLVFLALAHWHRTGLVVMQHRLGVPCSAALSPGLLPPAATATANGALLSAVQ
ncbi:progestin and adipoQ receptor family member 3-like isoform X1 [Sycon ciliatum]|uniref:progestin and adipoQ receptor family member 3-like isoform X1 n=1 Tax=Sycon ciliatum TaxID=27933 RepID=UPI0031F63A38